MKYLLVLLLLSGQAFAQSHSKALDTTVTKAKMSYATATTKEIELSPATSIRMSETDYYKKLYEQSVESENKFIELSDRSTTYTLTVVFGVIGLLAIAQILYSFVISKRQVAELKNDIDSKVLEKLELQKRNIDMLVGERITSNQTEFRISINRELDDYKASLQALLATNLRIVEVELRRLTDIANTSSTLSAARRALEKGSYELALDIFLDVSKVRINEVSIDEETVYELSNYTNYVKELKEITYEKIVKIRVILDAAKHPNAYRWAVVADKWPVYKNVNNLDGTTRKEYVRNAPVTL